MNGARVPEEARPRLPWYILTGLVFGLLLGIFYAWYIDPLEYQDASPARLRQADKEQYRAMIALAYSVDGDKGRAAARLAVLGDSDPLDTLSTQAQKYLGGNGPLEEARAMAQLASDLRDAPVILPTPPVPQRPLASVPSNTPTYSRPTSAAAASSPTATENPTSTAPVEPADPTLTPSVTPGAPFGLMDQTPLCDPAQPEGQLQVMVNNIAGEPVPGVRVVVTWQGGEDFFFTGLSPAISPGYADFQMSGGQTYTIKVGEKGEPVSGIQPPTCTRPDGSAYLGNLQLRFRQ